MTKTKLREPLSCNRTRLAGHSRLRCQSCHTAAAPFCIGCHTEEEEEGVWVESVGERYFAPPVLGVRNRSTSTSSETVIDTFVPGMIMALSTKGKSAMNDFI